MLLFIPLAVCHSLCSVSLSHQIDAPLFPCINFSCSSCDQTQFRATMGSNKYWLRAWSNRYALVPHLAWMCKKPFRTTCMVTTARFFQQKHELALKTTQNTNSCLQRACYWLTRKVRVDCGKVALFTRTIKNEFKTQTSKHSRFSLFFKVVFDQMHTLRQTPCQISRYQNSYAEISAFLTQKARVFWVPTPSKTYFSGKTCFIASFAKGLSTEQLWR